MDMENRGPDILSVLHVAHDIASGMRHLHSRDIIHGDLTPKNVLLKREGDGIVAKISDFGLSVHLQKHQSHVPNHRAGTPLYMAPELRRSGELSKLADVYSFGVILWELFHLSLPKPMVFAHNVTKPQFSSSCPMPYILLCATCLSPDPVHRMDFLRISHILRNLMQVLRCHQLTGNSVRTMNQEWSKLVKGMGPSQVVELLERRLQEELAAGCAGCEESASPTGSTHTDVMLWSSLSAAPELKLQCAQVQEHPSLPLTEGSEQLFVSTEEVGEDGGQEAPLMESVTVEVSLSESENDVVSFGWENSRTNSHHGDGGMINSSSNMCSPMNTMA